MRTPIRVNTASKERAIVCMKVQQFSNRKVTLLSRVFECREFARPAAVRAACAVSLKLHNNAEHIDWNQDPC